jgi:hypothetical protein
MTTRDVNYNFGTLNYTIKSPNISSVGTFDLQTYKSPYPDAVQHPSPYPDSVKIGDGKIDLEPPYFGPTLQMPQVDDISLNSIHRYIVKDDYGNTVVDMPTDSGKIQTPDAVSKKTEAINNYYNQTKPIAYKYNEGETLKDITAYVNKTYSEHYSQNKFQATEFIIDCGHGEGHCIGNMLKYTQRYGRKGDHNDWKKDLLKVIHYAIMMLHVHDQQHNNKEYKIWYRN